MPIRGKYKTRQRELVATCLEQHAGSYLTVDRVLACIDDAGEHVGRTTVYRALESMAAEGAALKACVPGGEAEPTNDYVASSSCSYADADVDVDLTQMSGTTVYSAVYQMMVDPQSYQDKVVKMQGIFYSQYNDVTDKRYFFVVVQDATACCAQGIEFVWDDGSHAYPQDYPAEGAEVVVCGRFGTYAERSSKFAYLNESSLALI